MRFSRELRNRLPATCDKRAGGWYPPAVGTCLSSATAAGEKWFAVPFLRLDSNQRGEDFPSARGTKNLCLAEGVSPRAWSRRPSACVWRSGYWFTTWRERSDWTRTSEAKIFRAREEPKIFASAYRSLLLWTRTRRNPKGAPQRSRRVEWLLVRVRGTDKARTPKAKPWGFLLYALPRLDSNQ